ncbi:MAG: DinB family protein [Saprospiraceae bacterium]|nr:DinB family protein [Saprospiraceae bacterium]MCB9318101.1 DinB family protein [Lewinellaceae bacterium]
MITHSFHHALRIIEELDRNRQVFRNLLSGVPHEMQTWRPGPDKWNLLEIICHLRDEEKEDFRIRVQMVLEDPDQTLPAIDPVGWVQSRHYGDQDFEVVLNSFLAERKRSVDWLQSLQDPPWHHEHVHPTAGIRSARLFFTNWLAHDYLHIRQITRLKYDYLHAMTGVALDYAGKWV